MERSVDQSAVIRVVGANEAFWTAKLKTFAAPITCIYSDSRVHCFRQFLLLLGFNVCYKGLIMKPKGIQAFR